MLLFLHTLDGLELLKVMIFPLSVLLLIEIFKKLIAVAHADGSLILSMELVLPKWFIDHRLCQRIYFPIGDGLFMII